jgi:hypothetical protein
MRRIDKILKSFDFIEYISKPMERKDIHLILKINGFITERGDLLLDFCKSLTEKIIRTYLGDDVMSLEDREKHFQWCWESVLKDFGKELIYFTKKGDLRDYFEYFFYEIFYSEETKEEKSFEKTLYFVIKSFNYNMIRTKSEIDNYLDLYKIFNKSYNVSV